MVPAMAAVIEIALHLAASLVLVRGPDSRLLLQQPTLLKVFGPTMVHRRVLGWAHANLAPGGQ